jgi:hypothetical protein
MNALIYRCERCGKWSHAQRKPRHHKRFSSEPADDDVILDEIEGYEPETGAYSPRFYVACGPFAIYSAKKVA